MDKIKMIKEYFSQYYRYILIGFIALIIILKLIFGMNEPDEEPIETINKNNSGMIENEESKESKQEIDRREISSKENIKEVIVDVKGAVKFPKTYEMKSSERINDVLKKAQINEQADLSKLNLSEKLKDQMSIYVPMKGEQIPSNLNKQSSQNENVEVNINTATKEQIQKIPGIGPSKADAIIKYREAKGDFKSIDDMKKIKGFGDKTVESLKEYVILN
ncbi:helix-hairpin-helix domain-containing protein [Staphylococcus lentus]|uniref:Helix-hairpin-helix domain-containing protein n=2 Tax=Mammaliicoccus lentus TaxID=42858 RepID=A0AAP1RTE6_MAMLE|nr:MULTISPECIES: helix-hairpin-helix domain-containing protein [Mammaliicoccus]MBF0747963.1 helix-hairpin-helix domain-containing protein [Mammaliicoccus lentus]MBF0842408.1 helix-hairpin-helix domain-containing protein [Mammaliicoccus lentus]MBW0761674.1 helix-hairpin-helix domain-containing protein [Mammaliicoccus lentus]MBW0766775.1 hypothetical protein [Mammaliicoccus lentus]MCR1872594.1 helix-hairpin-helix domain-containing protein [Mammaliicoccus lentus]